jgi:hypothetical protein
VTKDGANPVGAAEGCDLYILEVILAAAVSHFHFQPDFTDPAGHGSILQIRRWLHYFEWWLRPGILN